ncbi:phosphatase 2C-like domain-containing protein [Fimicolochytrium jonesii]|uniref:phosphatase 2C-like domain-containing protein n=1 Tax=Fimicolochytrium jonesii TaxID=1396493 RepID=UPI0022FEEE37|nr:phosphatase 2C-like domain-containing protein [Fimicolochytrium jonesii]KAI8822847.1 phosphatase 2C-like domain-containing protein [Fimicolochytrium jonesii]
MSRHGRVSRLNVLQQGGSVPQPRSYSSVSKDESKPAATKRPPFRLHLEESPGLLATKTDRGDREQNEDRSSYALLQVPCPEDPDTTLDVYWFAVFDGHGGSECSEYLKSHLHTHFSTVTSIDLQSTLTELSTFYNRPLSVTHPPPPHTTEHSKWTDPLTLQQRLYVAFLKAELEFFKTHDGNADSVGSTASVVVIRPIHRDETTSPPSSSTGATARTLDTQTIHLDLLIAHLGDSRILLCAGDKGIAHPLTTAHVPSVESEKARITQLGGFTTAVPVPTSEGDGPGDTDSAHHRARRGEAVKEFPSSTTTSCSSSDSAADQPDPSSSSSPPELVLGALAVSRCFGDLKFKKFGGVIAEPQIVKRTLDHRHNAAFLCLVTDGVSGVAFDQEICDVVKNAPTPAQACDAVIKLSDSLGSTDNKTVTIVRLPGWMGPPTSASQPSSSSSSTSSASTTPSARESMSGTTPERSWWFWLRKHHVLISEAILGPNTPI